MLSRPVGQGKLPGLTSPGQREPWMEASFWFQGLCLLLVPLAPLAPPGSEPEDTNPHLRSLWVRRRESLPEAIE